MPRPLFIANWKMFHSLETAEDWLDWWARNPLPSTLDALIAIAPPAPLIYPILGAAKLRAIGGLAVMGQDLYENFKGAFTGAVSGVSLWSVGATAVLVGHSERRSLFGDTDARIAAKMEQAFLCGLAPVLCIGETAEERDAGETQSVIERQLATALERISAETILQRQSSPAWPPFAIAYEPVWAIGSGRPATPALAEEVLELIRAWLDAHYPPEIASEVPLLYGGSVAPENAASFGALTLCDGLLVGGASLDPATFHAILVASLGQV